MQLLFNSVRKTCRSNIVIGAGVQKWEYITDLLYNPVFGLGCI